MIFIAVTSCARHSSVIEYQLTNGLKVIIIPIKKGELVSLVTLYSIGETSDPQGKSGRAHLIEHLYVTSSAGEFPSRNIERFMADYPNGWNAQTGIDYTVIATVFTKDQLDKELNMAAARMKNVNITEDDIDREIPRIENELINMYHRIPMLASQNLSAEMLYGYPSQGRKGGVTEQLRAITIDELRVRMNTYYKPTNAQIIISGPVDPETIMQRIEELFSNIETGVAISADNIIRRADHDSLQIKVIASSFPNAQSNVTLSYLAPSPIDRLYPAFLVLVYRLLRNSEKLILSSNTAMVIYAAFDRPEIASLGLPVEYPETPEKVLERLVNYVNEMRMRKSDKKEIRAAKRYFEAIFRRETFPDHILSRDPYGIAFSLGRKKQMGINGDSLARQIAAVTDEELSAAAECFSPEKSAAVIVKVKK